MNLIGRYIAGQFRRPSGLAGRFIGNGMAARNAYEAEWTVSLLRLAETERVLEVGFGPGVAIAGAADRAKRGLVAGVDASAAMVAAARRRNAEAIADGRVELRLGDVCALPYPQAAFDAAFTIHCVYFWTDPEQGFRELARVLKPGGRLAVTLMPREIWLRERPDIPADIFKLYSGADIQAMLNGAGFHSTAIQPSPQPEKFPGVCVVGIAP